MEVPVIGCYSVYLRGCYAVLYVDVLPRSPIDGYWALIVLLIVGPPVPPEPERDGI